MIEWLIHYFIILSKNPLMIELKKKSMMKILNYLLFFKFSVLLFDKYL